MSIAAILYSVIGLALAAGLAAWELAGRAARRAEARQPRPRGGKRTWAGSDGGQR